MVAPATAILARPPPSTSGPGRHPFKVVARVRIPLGASFADSAWLLAPWGGVSARRNRGSCPTSALNDAVVVPEQLVQSLRDPARGRAFRSAPRRAAQPRPRY